MSQFAGFDDWVPIFRGGKQIDSQGGTHDGDALIDTAISKFNTAAHEPPVCIGHPKDNAPAFGWVQALKAIPEKGGKLLLAKFKQVHPVFADAVKQGLYKKRSAAFYPDGRLRHVGFLGAMPPAVKGLPDIGFAEFAEGDALTFRFSDYQTVWAWESIARLFGKIRDYLIEKDGVEKADQIISTYQIEEISTAANKEKEEINKAQESVAPGMNYNENKEVKGMKFADFKQKLTALLSSIDESGDPAPEKKFSEAEVATAIARAEETAAKNEREKVSAEFAEKERTALKNARKTEIAAFCDSMVAAGKMTPAMVKFGVPQFMEAFSSMDGVIEFGEGDGKKEASLYDRFREFFEKELPKVVEFTEIATRGKDTGADGGAGAKVEVLIKKKMDDNKELSYSAAFAEVQRDNPELAGEYAAEIKEG